MTGIAVGRMTFVGNPTRNTNQEGKTEADDAEAEAQRQARATAGSNGDTAPEAGNRRLACAYGGHQWVRGSSVAGSLSVCTRDCPACGSSYIVTEREWLALEPAPADTAPESGEGR